MFPKEKRIRQAKLTEYIYELSERLFDGQSNEEKEIADKLKVIYTDNFRHSYSDFFPVVLKIFQEDNNYNGEYLMNNLQKIRDFLDIDYSNGINEYQDMYSQFIKLCEHLNLQISQLTYFSSTEEQVKDANKNIETAIFNLGEAKKELESANNKANTMQTELIAVLSIFSAIVITFAGGFELIGNAISAVASENVNLYKLILICLIGGFVFFNTVFLMMYLVSKITKRSIYAKCITEDCSCEQECNGMKKIRKRLPYIFYFNAILILFVIIDSIFVWKLK
ncbi:MAG: hypothetical protein ACI4DL_09625 [Lachnospiraceae bacterium]